MTTRNRKTAVENFKMFLQDYRILIEQKADISSQVKTQGDYFDKTSQKIEELIQTYENTIVELYNNTLL